MTAKPHINSLTIPSEVTDLASFQRFLLYNGTTVETLWERWGAGLLLQTREHNSELFFELVEKLTPKRCLNRILDISTLTLSAGEQRLALLMVTRIGRENLGDDILEKLYYSCPMPADLHDFIIGRIPSLSGRKTHHGLPPVPSVSIRAAGEPTQGEDGREIGI